MSYGHIENIFVFIIAMVGQEITYTVKKQQKLENE